MFRLLLIGMLLSQLSAVAQSGTYLFPLQEGQHPVQGTPYNLDYSMLAPRNLGTVAPGHAFPVIVVLDMQNSYGYQHIIQSLDYLMTLGSAPTSIVVGIGFTPANRLPLTRSRAAGGQMEAFFPALDSLLAGLKAWQVQAGSILLVGHSRTATLALEGLMQHPDQYHAAIAASPGGFGAAEKSRFRQMMQELSRKKARRAMYLSSGDAAHLEAEARFRDLTQWIAGEADPAWLEVSHQVFPCDHILSRTIGLLPQLNQYYQPYSLALNEALKAYDDGHFAPDSTQAILLRHQKGSGMAFPLEEVFLHSAYGRLIQDYTAGKRGAEQLVIFTDWVQAYLQIYPRDPFAYEVLADLHHHLGDSLQSRSALRSALTHIEAYSWETPEEAQAFRQQIETTLSAPPSGQ